jgi:hypothetical protein
VAGACLHRHPGLGCEPARPHGHHQGDPDLLPGQGQVGGALRSGRPADVGSSRPAPVRHEGRGDSYHQPQRAAVLSLPAQPAVAHRVPDGLQATRLVFFKATYRYICCFFL